MTSVTLKPLLNALAKPQAGYFSVDDALFTGILKRKVAAELQPWKLDPYTELIIDKKNKHEYYKLTRKSLSCALNELYNNNHCGIYQGPTYQVSTYQPCLEKKFSKTRSLDVHITGLTGEMLLLTKQWYNAQRLKSQKVYRGRVGCSR